MKLFDLVKKKSMILIDVLHFICIIEGEKLKLLVVPDAVATNSVK